MQEHLELKERLKVKFGITYNKKDSWHIQGRDLELLRHQKVIEKPAKSFKDLLQELFTCIEMIEEEELKISIKTLFKSYTQFYIVPASKYYHHDYKHGLLEYTIETIQFALLIYQKYCSQVQLNKDLVIAGSMLHDFGKTNCLDIDNEETIHTQDIEKLEGHIINGVKIVSQNIKSNIIDKIIHVIASHHRLIEWSSSVSPILYEAKIVHIADYLSSQMLGRDLYG